MTVITPEHITMVKARNGKPTLKVLCEDGKSRAVHSLYDPEAEAAAVVDTFSYDGRGILVVLGLGLGYHIVELSRRYPDTAIVVAEASTEISELQRRHGPVLNEQVTLIAGLPYEELMKNISERQMKDGISPLSVFTYNPAVSTQPSYYLPVLKALEHILSVRLWDRLKHAKFRTPEHKVLILDSGYFLVREVESAIQSIGHQTSCVAVRKDAEGKDLISGFVSAILDFKPDFILTINHLGFDKDGVLTSFFESIEMPVASWYVDSPRLIAGSFEKNISPFVSVFSWDRDYIAQLIDAGFESVEYLPLAADEKVFRPMPLKRGAIGKYRSDVSFVGNSLVDKTREKMAKIPGKLLPAVEKTAREMSAKGMSHNNIGEIMYRDDPLNMMQLSPGEKRDLEAAVLWKATLLYRLACIKKLKGFDFRINGDSGWRELLDTGFSIGPALNYYKDLPRLYNSCTVNFNATHLQMGHAVNQRVFDVPACGAFLLTDHQSSLYELFETGKEVVTYRDIEEIQDLVRFYLDNPSARDAIVKKARERVLKEHTYRHRLTVLIEAMKGRFS